MTDTGPPGVRHAPCPSPVVRSNFLPFPQPPLLGRTVMWRRCPSTSSFIIIAQLQKLLAFSRYAICAANRLTSVFVTLTVAQQITIIDAMSWSARASLYDQIVALIGVAPTLGEFKRCFRI